jgi:hypothetical protein
MVIDEFNWCFCSVVGEKVISATEVILIGNPINSVFDPRGEVIGVSGSYWDVEMWIVGELDVY